MKTARLRHGTLNAYTNRGCRCERCRKAHARYMKRYRKAKLTGPCPTAGCPRRVCKSSGTGYCAPCSRVARA